MATTYVLAAGVCLTAALVTGVLAALPIPGPVPETVTALSLPVEDRSVSVLWFVCLPFGLALAVVVRAGVTRTPADAVLVAFAVPCLLVTTWALYRSVRTRPGVSPGSLLSLFVGTLLSIVLLADGVLARVAVPERH